MSHEELVRRYLDAWNRRDVSGVLKLMHTGAAVYDSLWRESCVGHDLAQYLSHNLAEDQYWYELVGDLIVTDNSVVYRYTGFAWDGSTVGDSRFQGAEVLNIMDGLILTASNYYFDPDPIVLREVAKLSARRHGEQTYANDGYGAYRRVHVKNRLSNAIARDKIYLDRELTLAKMAQQISCKVDELLKVLRSEFGTNFEEYVNQHRVKFATEALFKYADDPNRVTRVASEAGFNSIRDFRSAFTSKFGINPEDFKNSSYSDS